jgi:adenylate kinase family enzyme
MLNIVLFGAPGCGKGTQAARLKEKYGIDHVSTGNVIREEIARGTKLGKEMESYITTGRLAPDQVVIDMIADYIAAHKHAKGNIFDGFPRTTHQAEEFDRMLSEQGLKVDVMIYMDVPEEELVKRILLRGKEKQLFSQTVDARDLHRLISSFSFHYVANSYTFTLLFEEGADEQAQRQHYRKMAVQVALRYTCP